MNSFDHLFEKVASWANLLDAARKAQRRKRGRNDVLEFNFSLEKELLQLQADLQRGCYKPGRYISFEITDPKRRLISAAPYRDRVLHHAICNVIEPLFENRFIHDSYACRRGKGQARALHRSRYFANRHGYLVKTDIKKFFASIDHQILIDVIKRKIRDKRLLDLLNNILKHDFPGQKQPSYLPGDDLFTPFERTCGLPIGNQTSQLCGNIYLDPIDHFIKEKLRAAGYVRYMDDLIVFADSKELGWEYLFQIEAKLLEIRLEMHPRKTSVLPTSVEFPFLGFHVSRFKFRPFRRTVVRFRRRMKELQRKLDEGEIQLADAKQSLAAYWGHFKICGQINRFKKIMSDFPFYHELIGAKKTSKQP